MSTTGTPMQGVRLASVSEEGLEALGPLRRRRDVTVRRQGNVAWVAWEPPKQGDRDEVVEALMPVQGAVFFREEGGTWLPVGGRLPDREAEDVCGRDGAIPLHRAVVPEPIRWVEPGRGPVPVSLAIVRDGNPRSASALLTSTDRLRAWAEREPSARITGLRAAWSGDRVLVVGGRLPEIAGAERFWGIQILIPMGYRADPALTERALARAIGLKGEDLGLIDASATVELVPGSSLATLSRASARRMAGIASRSVSGPGGEPR